MKSIDHVAPRRAVQFTLLSPPTSLVQGAHITLSTFDSNSFRMTTD